MLQNPESEYEQFILFSAASSGVRLLLPVYLSRRNEWINQLSIDYKSEELSVRHLNTNANVVPIGSDRISFRLSITVPLTSEEILDTIKKSSYYELLDVISGRHTMYSLHISCSPHIKLMIKNGINYANLVNPTISTARFFALINILFIADSVIEDRGLDRILEYRDQAAHKGYTGLLGIYMHINRLFRTRRGRKSMQHVTTHSKFCFILPFREIADSVLLEFDNLMDLLEAEVNIADDPEYYVMLNYISEILYSVTALPRARVSLICALRHLASGVRSHKDFILKTATYGNDIFYCIEDMLKDTEKVKFNQSLLRNCETRS